MEHNKRAAACSELFKKEFACRHDLLRFMWVLATY